MKVTVETRYDLSDDPLRGVQTCAHPNIDDTISVYLQGHFAVVLNLAQAKDLKNELTEAIGIIKDSLRIKGGD